MQVDILNDHLVYRPDNIDQHRVVFPELKVAEVRGQTYAAVPLSLANSQLLNNMGYTPPTPMRTAYKWPGRYKPYKHQLITAEFFALNRRAFCNNGLGTGKTLATLWAADYLMSIGAVQKCLIVSPLSTLECVWAKEIFINFPRRKSATLHGSRQKRLTLLNENVDFYIINHDGIGTIIEELRQRRDIDLIVIDELAVMRNAKTERFKIMKSLITPEKWAWGLTGTPTPNAPTDAYGQVKLIKPENFNGNFTKFKNITMVQISPFKWIARTGSEQVINQVMHPRIRYALEDCVDLPPTIYHEREAQLSPDQQKHFTKLQREAATEIDGKEVTAVNAAVLVSKLLQTACGVAYAGDERAKLDFGPRLNVLKECINEAKAKVIVFVPFTGALEALHTELVKDWTCAIVDGSTSKGKRDTIFNAFQENPNPKIIIANAQAMSHGVTLTAADTIIWYCPPFSNEVYEQANARIIRPGQTLHTNIVHIYGTTVERKVYGVLKERGKLQSLVLDLLKK